MVVDPVSVCEDTESMENSTRRSDLEDDTYTGELRDIFDRSPLHYIGMNSKLTNIDMSSLRAMILNSDRNAQDIGGLTPLHYAIRLQNRDAVQYLLKLGCDINISARDGMTALHYAASRSQDNDESVFIVNMLLENGSAQVNALDNFNRTPLHWAVISGATAIATKLLDNGASLHLKDNFGRTPLHLTAFCDPTVVRLSDLVQAFQTADKQFSHSVKEIHSEGLTVLHLSSRIGNFSLLEMLLNIRPEILELVNCADRTGRTPLSWAAEKGCVQEVQLLLQHGAQVNKQDNFCQTPISWAVRAKNLDVAEILWKSGAIVDSVDNTERDLLSWAAETGQTELVGILIENSKGLFSINSKDDKNQTPLIWASKEGHKDVVEYLSSQPQIDLNCKDSTHGRTALIWASKKGFQSVAKLLVSVGVELNVRDNSGSTALIWAAREGHSKVIRSLLEHLSIDVNCRDNVHQQTALDWAMEDMSDWAIDIAGDEDDFSINRAQTVKLLISHPKVDVNARDPVWGRGYTPLERAVLKGHTETIELLLRNPRVDLDLADSRWRLTPLQDVLTNSRSIANRSLGRVIEVLISGNLESEDLEILRIIQLSIGDGQSALVESILRIGREKPALYKVYGGSILKTAVLWGNGSIVENCILAGVNVLWKDEYHWTPWLCALASRNSKIQDLFSASPELTTTQPHTLLPQTKALMTWSLTDKWGLTDKSNLISLDESGLIATCTTESEKTSNSNRHLVQANIPFSGQIYFEITILQPFMKNQIGIGLCNGPSSYKNTLPGWNKPGMMSWGYYGHDGSIHDDRTHGTSGSQRTKYQKFGQGDVIGCGVDQKNCIFFTKNGRDIGAYIDNVTGQLFAVVGCATGGEFRANFGQQEFRYKWENSGDSGVQLGIPV